MVFLKKFFVLGILILSFAACSVPETASKNQSSKSPDNQDNPPISFDESINIEFSFDESLGAELAQPSEVQGAVLEVTEPNDDTLTYELVEMDTHPGDHTHFTVDSKSGQISKKNENYDYETKDSYTFAVKVSNNASPPQSDQIQVTLTVNNLNETPLAPTGLIISSGDSKMVVSWEAPDNTGRPEITDYIIYWDTTSGGTANEEMSNGDTIYTLTGLNNSTTYYIHVKAKNADGLGETSLIDFGIPNVCPRCGQLLGSALGESFTNPFHSIQLSLDFHEDSSDPYKVQVLGDLYIKSFTSPACSIPAGKYKVTTTQAGVGSFTHLIGGLVLQASGPSQIELRGGEFIPDSIEQTSGCSGKSYSHGFSWTNGYLFSGGGTQCNYPITLDIPPRGRTFPCQ